MQLPLASIRATLERACGRRSVHARTVSHCANYVLRFDGEQRVGNTRWGAVGLPGNIFFGPDEALGFLLEALDDPDTAFAYDELMCEAGVLADYDAKRLLIYGGEDLRYEVTLQNAYMEMLRLMWPGWQVNWAHGGWQQIAGEAGIEFEPAPRDYFRPVSELKAFAPAKNWNAPVTTADWLWNRGAGYLAVITVRDEHGVRDHGVLHTREQLVPTGARMIEMLADVPVMEPAPSLHCAWVGLVIDVPAKIVAYWQGRELESFDAPALAAGWPGWTVVLDDRGVDAHFRRTGRDPGSTRISPDVTREVVANLLLGNASGDGIGTLVAEIRERAKAPNVTTPPGATRTPPSNYTPLPTRREILARVLAELAAAD